MVGVPRAVRGGLAGIQAVSAKAHGIKIVKYSKFRLDKPCLESSEENPVRSPMHSPGTSQRALGSEDDKAAQG